MCGRYNLITQSQAWADGFGLLGEIVASLEPRVNIKPGTDIPLFYSADGETRLIDARWGYRPIWAKDDWKGPIPINTRAEKLGTGMWRGAKRCVIPMSGFYEPGKPAGVKWKSGEPRRYFLYRGAANEPLFAAGVLSGGEHSTTSMVTVEANQTVAASTHNRMPALLSHDLANVWMDKANRTHEVRELLEPASESVLKAYPVNSMGELPENSDGQ